MRHRFRRRQNRYCYHTGDMQRVNVGIVGLGNVGLALSLCSTENAKQIDCRENLGFDLKIKVGVQPVRR